MKLVTLEIRGGGKSAHTCVSLVLVESESVCVDESKRVYFCAEYPVELIVMSV